jgi:hypothetical protein
MVAQLLKREEKRTWQTELVVVAEGGGGVADGAMVGVASTAGMKVLFPRSVPLRMYAGLTLSVDTVMGLPRTKSCSVFSLRDSTW